MSTIPAEVPVIYNHTGKFWIKTQLSDLTLPQYIEGTAKGTLLQRLKGEWFREVKEFTHPNARRGQYYYADDPEKRVAISAASFGARL